MPKKLLKEVSLPNVRFHDLRHGAATVLLATKVDLKVVSELLGHSSVAITADSLCLSISHGSSCLGFFAASSDA